MKPIIFFLTLCLASNLLYSQEDEVRYTYTDSLSQNYRTRLIDYADIYSYEIDPKTKDTLLYVRKINDFWYGLYGASNFALSFGDFKSKVDPINNQNIFNTVVNFYSQFGAGYSLGVIGE